MTVEDLNDKTFNDVVLQPGVRALVDFWGPHCAPCVGISRQIDQFALSYKGAMRFYKVNAEDAIETAATFGVRGLPTLMLFEDKKRIATQTGALSPAKLEALLKDWGKV